MKPIKGKAMFFLKLLISLGLLMTSIANAQDAENSLITEEESRLLNRAMMCGHYVRFYPRIEYADYMDIQAEEHAEKLLESKIERDILASGTSDAAYMQVEIWNESSQESIDILGDYCTARYIDLPLAESRLNEMMDDF
ncbi:hypothetical protein QC823_15580 [Halomonas vilamensis]|uniref:Uncharacterized protein n=1 Tax=Vreelandella vilamensis TaxID=531309 RepID=A0ABU1H7V7_9GAMM|nr:hypothetical protein [Halomonas vilamensis]MDR5900386.1 hypothetical protein [Halomonas vilamensis]